MQYHRPEPSNNIHWDMYILSPWPSSSCNPHCNAHLRCCGPYPLRFREALEASLFGLQPRLILPQGIQLLGPTLPQGCMIVGLLPPYGLLLLGKESYFFLQGRRFGVQGQLLGLNDSEFVTWLSNKESRSCIKNRVTVAIR